MYTLRYLTTFPKTDTVTVLVARTVCQPAKINEIPNSSSTSFHPSLRNSINIGTFALIEITFAIMFVLPLLKVIAERDNHHIAEQRSGVVEREVLDKFNSSSAMRTDPTKHTPTLVRVSLLAVLPRFNSTIAVLP